MEKMEDCPEFQEAIQTLVRCFHAEEEGEGQLKKDGALEKKIEAFKAARKQRRGNKDCQRKKRDPDKKCNDVPRYCKMVGQAIRAELGKDEESEDDGCD